MTVAGGTRHCAGQSPAPVGSTHVPIATSLTTLLSLGGCQSKFIVLRNPTTGEIKECKTNSGASFFPIAQTALDNSANRSCTAGYQAAGYIRMN